MRRARYHFWRLITKLGMISGNRGILRLLWCRRSWNCHAVLRTIARVAVRRGEARQCDKARKVDTSSPQYWRSVNQLTNTKFQIERRADRCLQQQCRALKSSTALGISRTKSAKGEIIALTTAAKLTKGPAILLAWIYCAQVPHTESLED